MSVGKHESRLVCPGQQDTFVSSGYIGPQEGVGTANPAVTGHAADVELVYGVPAPGLGDQFALAWVAMNGEVWVKRYNTQTKVLDASPVKLNYYNSLPPWVRRLGWDDNCVAMGRPQCGWFTWFEANDTSVNWRPVSSDGTPGVIRYHPGRFPSGDTGRSLETWGWVRKMLLAWISTDNRYVKARVLNNDGSYLGPELTLQSLPGNNVWRAYQTAVAWNAVEKNWLVVWTEDDTRPAGQSQYARIKSRRINFDGTMSASVQDVVSCGYPTTSCGSGLGLPDPAAPVSSRAAPLAKAPASDGGGSPPSGPGGITPMINSGCICSGIWLASSGYSGSDDRFRIYQYGLGIRLNGAGVPVGNPSSMGWHTTWGPLTEASFTYAGQLAPFQILANGMTSCPGGACHGRFLENSFTVQDTVQMSSHLAGQGYRASASVAVGLVTDDGTNTQLYLSVADVRTNGCPP